MKKYDESVDIVEQNIRNKPSDIQSHRILINFLIDLQQYEKVSKEALTDFSWNDFLSNLTSFQVAYCHGNISLSIKT